MSLLLALAAIGLSGLGLATLSGLRGPPRWALAPLLGLGVWSSTYAATLFAFGADPAVRFLKDAALAAFGLASLVVLARKGSTAPPAIVPERARRGLRIALALTAILSAALFVEHSIRYPDGGWDAWMIWNLRARALARAGAAFNDAFSPELLFWVHQDYPLLLPGTVAQGFLIAGSEPRWIPALVAFVFAGLAVTVLVSSLDALRRRDAGLLGAIALLTTPCFIGFAANQQSDVPVGAFLLATSALLAAAIERGERRLFALAGFCASLAAWTKNEGALHAACLATTLAAVPWGPWRERRRALLRFAAGAVPVILLLAWFKLRVSHVNDLFHTARLGSLLELHRWGTLAGALLRRLVFFQSWALWLIAELVVLVAVLPRVPARPAARVVGLALAGALAATSIVYLIQPHELLWFVRASFDRILIQLWPSILLATLLALTPPDPASRLP